MAISYNRKDIDKIIMVGDRVLIKPKTPQERTKAGLYLPPSIEKKANLYDGYVIKVGPGFPIPTVNEVDEPWKEAKDEAKFVPIQPKIGDLAVYLQNNSYEISFNDEKYYIVPSSAILMLLRDAGLMEN
ncbi:MAG: co-chaperone GroES [Bacteroidales bacterium]|nr:co-chaperone GroES [Bacteroidales bacterium]